MFWVPQEARWAGLQDAARQSDIGGMLDDAMAAIEHDNPVLKGVLPKDYARPEFDKVRLGQLIDMVGNIKVGDAEARSKDVLGRVYEYFLSQFASAEGKRGGEFYTPRCVVKLLVEMLEPYSGRVYDPCCGSSGMFVQSVEFIRAHATGYGHPPTGAKADISIYGQESNYTTWRLAKNSSRMKTSNRMSIGRRRFYVRYLACTCLSRYFRRTSLRVNGRIKRLVSQLAVISLSSRYVWVLIHTASLETFKLYQGPMNRNIGLM